VFGIQQALPISRQVGVRSLHFCEKDEMMSACLFPSSPTHRGYFLTKNTFHRMYFSQERSSVEISSCGGKSMLPLEIQKKLLKSEDDVPKWDCNHHSQYFNVIFQDLLDGVITTKVLQ
jgi:hypothetical protein